MAEQLNGNNLSPLELKLNEERQARLDEGERYRELKERYLGQVATEAGVVPSNRRYDAQEAARTEIALSRHNTQQ